MVKGLEYVIQTIERKVGIEDENGLARDLKSQLEGGEDYEALLVGNGRLRCLLRRAPLAGRRDTSRSHDGQR